LKPEPWGSSLVQEKYRGEQACDKTQGNNNNDDDNNNNNNDTDNNNNNID